MAEVITDENGVNYIDSKVPEEHKEDVKNKMLSIIGGISLLIIILIIFSNRK